MTTLITQFDDRTAPLLPADPNVAVNVYRGLFYRAFNIRNLASPTSGSTPRTSPNGIPSSLVITQLTRGTPTLTVDYLGSKPLYFNFERFYFGCVTPTQQGAAQIAVQCSVLVAGFNAANKQVAVATYTFTPPVANVAKAPMIEAQLPSGFVNLRNVTIVQSSPATQVLLLDNAKYTLATSS
ncbi:MAG: hypothetical protein L6R38_002640 [Xanthoria sp. 2 TBL-2021]|nr:MAG: hypothetical protein L6R38_002640 [Xanthoria sp. 2 TBL-2021]